ncbi:IclR family transcriptional regulator [Actinoplanes utahensis]|uniref:IclR family transcriptional regulator n=1 Tax=Actinoplanes utahensis TaxID=1869 RepID=A0A0A6UEL8_ACTUT|nr:IclR family transcriptional regulator [Actinoplanes utahensis]KHD74480.1 IclR family transcriptional regulator [Actinoplanes utahensis]GIF31453.1 putative IclR-family regulatory protein [Actinoplanes utahensis]
MQGSQLVSRVGAVLRRVSSSASDGATTADVAAATGLPRSTAQRVLAALAEEGFVDRDARRGRWFLGPELFLLGSVAAERYDVTSIARDVLRTLADRSGESAFFSARRGEETVCLAGEEGSFPLRSHVLHEGIRLPLGVASAGLAILALLPPDDATAYARRRGADLAAAYGEQHDTAALLRRVASTRRRGYAVNPGMLVPGSWGVGAVVFDRAGSAAWALSLTGVESRFDGDRTARLGALLLEAAHTLSQRIARR